MKAFSDAARLLVHLAEYGIHLFAMGRNLYAQPDGAIEEWQVRLVRKNHDALVELLTGDAELVSDGGEPEVTLDSGQDT